MSPKATSLQTPGKNPEAIPGVTPRETLEGIFEETSGDSLVESKGAIPEETPAGTPRISLTEF